LGARLRQRCLEALRDRGAQFALASGVCFGKSFEIGGDRGGVEEFAGGAGGALNIEHHRNAIAESVGAVIVARRVHRRLACRPPPSAQKAGAIVLSIHRMYF
jgi:hypothetical protein